MKKVMGLGWSLLAVPAMAQFMGLPVAGAGLRPAGAFRHRAGWCSVMISTCTACGRDGPVGESQFPRGCGDAGPGRGDTGWAIQGGGLYRHAVGLSGGRWHPGRAGIWGLRQQRLRCDDAGLMAGAGSRTQAGSRPRSWGSIMEVGIGRADGGSDDGMRPTRRLRWRGVHGDGAGIGVRELAH